MRTVNNWSCINIQDYVKYVIGYISTFVNNNANTINMVIPHKHTHKLSTLGLYLTWTL